MAEIFDLQVWHERAIKLENQLNKLIVGQQNVIRLLLIGVFARGHILLEGNVGVGKTTLLRTLAHLLGGVCERIEGTIDLMPNDLIYHTYIDENGKPRVDPGPIIKNGNKLAIFFFNEINRARPQIHSLLLRVMSEQTVNAFNRDYHLPHIQIFADRNQVEREETYELPAAARDRFMFEIAMRVPTDNETRADLIFNPRYHHYSTLINVVDDNYISYYELNEFANYLQTHIYTSDTIKKYVLDLWDASCNPIKYGITLTDIDINHLVYSAASPRGMSYLIRAARVNAWMNSRAMVVPEDIIGIFQACIAHRLILNPVYEFRRSIIIDKLIVKILNSVIVP